MTDYCTAADVSALTGWTYDTTSQPTDTEVGDIITEISAEIDAVLRAVEYPTVPVTDANDLAFLKRYAKIGAAYNAWLAGVDHASEPANVATWKEDYRAFLQRLAAGKLALPGQVPTVEVDGWASVEVTRQDGFADQATEYSR